MKKIFIPVLILVFLCSAYVFLDNSDILNFIPETVEPYNETGYFYRHMSNNSKKAYDLIMHSIYSFPEKIPVPSLTNSELDEIYEAVLYDNTDTFFLKETCSTSVHGLRTYFYPEYEMTKEEYEQKMLELEKKEDEIISSLETNDEYETELFLHDTVVNSCRYSSEITSESSSPYGCLVAGEASCEGYSRAIKRLLDKCSIENFFSIGNVKNSDGSLEGHLWNIVKINSNFYHLDATWNDNNNDVKKMTYSYFNVNDEMIEKTHVVDNRFSGICTSIDENYFVKNNIYFTDYNENAKNTICKKLCENADKGLSRTLFMFSNRETYLKAKRDLFDNENIYRLLIRANSLSSKSFITNKVNYLPDEEHFVLVICDYYK